MTNLMTTHGFYGYHLTGLITHGIHQKSLWTIISKRNYLRQGTLKTNSKINHLPIQLPGTIIPGRWWIELIWIPLTGTQYIHRIRSGHFGGLSWIDSQIERIIEKLEEKGKLENTIIIFTADHGAHLGDHNLIHKGTHYERSSHVPFVIWWPEALKPGRVKGFTSHVDLFPTLVELAGGSLPEGLEGKSYYKLLRGKENAPDTAIIEIIGNTALVTRDYKFGLYRQYREGDLYDREKDPEEFYNLINEAEYNDLINGFTRYLYSKDPTLQHDYKNARLIKPLAQKLTLKNGERAAADSIPYLGGESFEISFELNYKNGQGGPVLVHHEGQHGLSLYIDKGILYSGFRTWNNDSIFKIRMLSPGMNKVMLSLNRDGILKASVNNILCAEHETSWPKPVQAGRKEYLKGIMVSGNPGLHGQGRSGATNRVQNLGVKHQI